VADILIVADEPTVAEEVRSALDDSDNEVRVVTSGDMVRAACTELPPDLVVTDMQVGSMGGIAICMDLRLEESGDRLPHIPVLILMDRRADVFLAKRSGAEGWLVKPLNSIRIRRAVRALLEGQTFHDESFKPLPLPAEVRPCRAVRAGKAHLPRDRGAPGRHCS
jgi:DNA-binding response OmpR family regulator